MTGTTVKGVAPGLANLAVNLGRNVKSTAGSGEFQNVWNSLDKSPQSAANEAGSTEPDKPNVNAGQKSAKPEEASTPEEASKPEEVSKPEEASKPEEVSTPEQDAGMRAKQQPPAAAEEKVSDAQPEVMSPERLEEAMEVLGAAVMELMREIADVFGISPEELQTRLQELGIAPTDLLQTENLSGLVLGLGGAEDSLALLTDEKLCDDYKTVMDKLTEVLEAASEKLDVTPEQMSRLPEEMKTLQTGTTADTDREAEQVSAREPEIEIAFEKADAGNRENAGLYQSDAAAQTDPGTQTVQPTVQPETDRNGGRQSGHEEAGGQHGQLFAQQLRPLQPETAPQEAQPMTQSAAGNAETQDIMRQIMDYMKVQLSAKTTNLEMHLHPESLGTLHVQVEAKAGVLTANFITQNEAVKAALESQMTQLLERFEEQGVKVQAIEVTVQPHEFERNPDQGRGRNQGDSEPSRRPRVRRINLGEMSGMEEEDALAARMLEASGGTVDYTA